MRGSRRRGGGERPGGAYPRPLDDFLQLQPSPKEAPERGPRPHGLPLLRMPQAVASEQQEGTRCDYTSTSICHPDADCTARLSLQDEYERWLEIPLLEGLSGPSMSAELGNAPYPTVGICNAAGCNRIEVRYWVDVEGNAHVLRESGVGAWFMKIGAPVSFGASPDPSRDGQFVEVRTFGLITEVRSGTCPGAVPTGGR